MRKIDPNHIAHEDLHAFIDDQLSQKDHEIVANWLKSHPEEAAMVADWQAQKQAIQSAFGNDQTVQERDLIFVEELLSQEAKSSSPLQSTPRLVPAIAAALLLFCLGGVFGAVLTNQYPALNTSSNRVQTADAASSYQHPLIQEAKTNYTIYTAEKRHKVEVKADEKKHLSEWLGKRLNKPDILPIPDLTAEGYDLIGGRLVPYQGKPSALLIYSTLEGTQLTILVGQLAKEGDDPETIRHFKRQGDLGTLAWRTESLGYAISAPLDQRELQRVADHIAM